MKKYNTFLRNSLNLAYWFVFVVLLTSGFIVILSTLKTPFAFKFLTVQSGSMEPAIKTGSIVLVIPNESYKTDDILNFENPDHKNQTITHRIKGIEYDQGKQTSFITKGDANENVDSEKISKSSVLGKVIFTIPYLGYLVNFIRKPLGTMIFVIIPATIFVISELRSIKEELIKLKTKKRKATI